jgi:hypothetical protein
MSLATQRSGNRVWIAIARSWLAREAVGYAAADELFVFSCFASVLGLLVSWFLVAGLHVRFGADPLVSPRTCTQYTVCAVVTVQPVWFKWASCSCGSLCFVSCVWLNCFPVLPCVASS